MLTKQYGAASCPSKMDHTSETDSSEKIRITNSEFSATLNKLVWIWNFFFFEVNEFETELGCAYPLRKTWLHV
jgi:hypothetical protein